MNHQHNICVKLSDGNWYKAKKYQEIAFKNFVNYTNFEKPYIYNNGMTGQDRIYFRIERINGINYLIKENNEYVPIADLNDVKVFLLDKDPVNWYSARNYQTWAYYDFIYSGKNECYYASYGSNNMQHNIKYVSIPFTEIEPNIIFRMSRNSNGSVFYERNNEFRTRIRISDSNVERENYLGFYNRMTMDIFSNYHSKQTLLSTQLVIPKNIIVEETDDDNEMCVVCNIYKCNIIYEPCGHYYTCSECTQKIMKNNNLKCPICRTVINCVKNISISWFEKIFGFNEIEYFDTRKKLIELFKQNNGKHFDNIKIGTFKVIDNEQMHMMFPQLQNKGTVSFQNIVDDIVEIHKYASSNNATIQVASQLNCLEMVDPNITPEHGITIYEYDNTQGPKCALCCPAGLAFRNYIYNGGQTADYQIDMSDKLLNFFQMYDENISWDVCNGYLMINSDDILIKINNLLNHKEFMNEAKKLIQSGFHFGQGVYKNNNVVNHVYCSGLPIVYNKKITNINLWDKLSKVFLDAMYENTLLGACLNNINNGEKKPCFLTMIGGGVFGMKHSLIIDAIQNACQMIATKGYSLDVKLVHYKYIHKNYLQLQTLY